HRCGILCLASRHSNVHSNVDASRDHIYRRCYLLRKNKSPHARQQGDFLKSPQLLRNSPAMRKTALLFGLLAIALLVVFSVARPAQRRVPQFDVLIRNGRIVDGSGGPWFRGDVGIVADRITALGTIGDATAATAIDATNLVVAPGFIDLLGQSEFNILVDSRAASKILQGVTTEVTGEGSSIAPVNDRLIQEASLQARHFGVSQDWRTLADYFKRLEERSRPAINM